jgi:hypothetical protein
MAGRLLDGSCEAPPPFEGRFSPEACLDGAEGSRPLLGRDVLVEGGLEGREPCPPEDRATFPPPPDGREPLEDL